MIICNKENNEKFLYIKEKMGYIIKHFYSMIPAFVILNKNNAIKNIHFNCFFREIVFNRCFGFFGFNTLSYDNNEKTKDQIVKIVITFNKLAFKELEKKEFWSALINNQDNILESLPLLYFLKNYFLYNYLNKKKEIDYDKSLKKFKFTIKDLFKLSKKIGLFTVDKLFIVPAFRKIKKIKKNKWKNKLIKLLAKRSFDIFKNTENNKLVIKTYKKFKEDYILFYNKPFSTKEK